ncbi:MAG: alpha/beta hydrolase domain-containing protein [Bryobacteraceae bacterium]
MLGSIVLFALPLCLQAAKVDLVLGPEQRAMNEPFGVDFDGEGNFYVVEHKGEVILRVGAKGLATTVYAGTGEVGNSGDGGPATQARMFDPHGIAITQDSAWMYVADTRNHTVRRIDRKTGIITTIAGTGHEGFSGDGGPATQATFRGTFGIALSPDDRALYIADLGNKRVRKVDLRNGVVTSVAGNGETGVPSDGALAKDSPLQDPRAVAVDSKHRVYILERNGNALRVIENDGKIRTLIAPGNITPNMKGPKHLCIDRQDRVVIADAENHLIRRFDPKSGVTTTIAGTGTKGTAIHAGDPLRTELNRPHGVFVTRSGDLYIADSYNHRILRVAESEPRAGVRLEIRERSDVEASVPYERLVGTAWFRLDPQHRLNRGITDIAHAAKDAGGMVEYSADFYILRPKQGGNRTLLFEASNRGGKGTLSMFNGASSSMDPRRPRDFGDERLLRQGYTLAWVGWQHDIAKGNYALRLHAPKSVGVSGEVRAQWIPDQPARRIPLGDSGHTAYAIADRDSVVVTERDGSQDAPRRLAPDTYRIESDAIVLHADAVPGRIYEVTYLSRDPEVAMIGLAAIRDFVTHLRNGNDMEHTIGFGVSQSAMLLRAFLHHGFNEGMDGKRVFDGVLAHTAGGRRIVYPRFAQPSRTAAPLRAVGYGTEGHMLERVAEPFAPKILYSNSAYEYWGATASLLHTTADGKQDVPLPESTRIYMLSGGQHGPSGFPPSRGRAVHLQNPNDYRPVVRALLERLREWLVDGKQPPPSRFPRIADGTLTSPAKLNRTSGIDFPRAALQPVGKPGIALVPQVDETGNDLGGVRTPDLAVPLAVYAGWNLRSAQIGQSGALIGNSGSFLPFSPQQVDKRYLSMHLYLRLWDEQAQLLAKQGLLLADEIPAMRRSAQAKWDWVHQQLTQR